MRSVAYYTYTYRPVSSRLIVINAIDSSQYLRLEMAIDTGQILKIQIHAKYFSFLRALR